LHNNKENLLLVDDIVKIADFGLAREIRSLPPYTDYVSTRWYRAPEILLRSVSYSSPIDIWAVGTIISELFTLQPLFPGSSEIDQIHRITAVCGAPQPINGPNVNKSPNQNPLPRKNSYYPNQTSTNRNRNEIKAGGIWDEGLKLSLHMGFKFPSVTAIPLGEVVPTAPTAALEIIADTLIYDPNKRPSASDILTHSWFEDFQTIKDVKEPLKQAADNEFKEISNADPLKISKKISSPRKPSLDEIDNILNSIESLSSIKVGKAQNHELAQLKKANQSDIPNFNIVHRQPLPKIGGSDKHQFVAKQAHLTENEQDYLKNTTNYGLQLRDNSSGLPPLKTFKSPKSSFFNFFQKKKSSQPQVADFTLRGGISLT
jgi:serine/threonine protein kinase